jgi:transcription termination/antitermination protein NusG
MSNPVEKKWYVVRAISGKEKKVKEYLEAEIAHHGLQSLIAQVLIPTEKVYQIRKGKKISKERNYFPGYVLIEAIPHGRNPSYYQIDTKCVGISWNKRRSRSTTTK